MRRSYAIPTSLALLLALPMVNPHFAAADPTPSLVGYQQSTSYVIQRALSQLRLLQSNPAFLNPPVRQLRHLRQPGKHGRP